MTVSDISHLIISHYHPDHMGIAQDLVDLGIRLVVLDKQKDYLHQSDAIFEKEKNQTFKPIVDELTLVISIRNSRDFLAGLGIDGEILWTPGHTKDSISLVLDSGHAFVGDLYPLDQVPLFKDATIIKS
ncbi:glyoxylase-like metal-dependent hydrolase (beta-lactamase superfamily II) [Streptococcus moroccensis]|uniref:Glyoxylase-like metal-dependent hydrolase (Beta-lactamase superfamily II) n=1 Tax=Streptococcus moroccensis TaxID=1451356 RepID=A0ABT9YPZ6_9STRE|nr:glyoxylase-like metal-dependent hydrolase (beta-lactamase superfamily II) [Streptococcus moroccensis]